MIAPLSALFLALAPAAAADEALPDCAVLNFDALHVLESGRWRRIEGAEGADTFCWDRDGLGLLITRGGELWRVGADGDARRLVAGFHALRFPDVHPESGAIAFGAQREKDEPWSIHLLERDGRAPRRLCAGYDPSWERATGSLLLEDHRPTPAIYRHDLRADEATRAFELAAHPELGEAAHTVCSLPSGAFAFSASGCLWTLDDARLTKVGEGPYDRFASASDDGRHLAFVRRTAQGPSQVLFHDLHAGRSRDLPLAPELGRARLVAIRPGCRFADLPQVVRYSTSHYRAQRESGFVGGLVPERDHPLLYWVQRTLDLEDEQHYGKSLLLPGVRHLSVDEARTLAAWRGSYLFLPELSVLSPDVARALSDSPAALFLDGLSQLDAEVFSLLAGEGRHRLSFDGLTEIDESLAEAIAAFDGAISLDGLTSIPSATLARLAAWSGNGEQFVLSLDGLRTLDPEQAAILAGCKGWGLSLGGLQGLSAELCTALEPLACARLILSGIRHLEPARAEAMTSWRAKWVDLPLLTAPPEVRELLSHGPPLFRLAREFPPLAERRRAREVLASYERLQIGMSREQVARILGVFLHEGDMTQWYLEPPPLPPLVSPFAPGAIGLDFEDGRLSHKCLHPQVESVAQAGEEGR